MIEVTILSAQDDYSSYGEISEFLEEKDYERLAKSFVITVSSSKILKDLGLTKESEELLSISKGLAGELIEKLSTNRYPKDLATQLSKVIDKFWKVAYDDFDLLKLLESALILRKTYRSLPKMSSSRISHEILRKLFKTMGKKNKEIKIAINPRDPLEVLQAVATSLALFVGGLSGF